jgi:3',5'-cyclic AMP phosphodiesterase CpdA
MKHMRLFVRFLLTALLLVSLNVTAQNGSVPFPFAVVGDTGCGCAAQKSIADRMMSWYQKNPFSVVLMLGDNIYGGGGVFGGGAGGGSKALFQDRFDRYYKPFIDKGVKFYATLGNHDYEVNRGQDEVADKNRFNILGDQGYYSFSPNVEVDGRPLIEFFTLNSVRLLKRNQDPAQIDWLSKKLTDSKAFWKVVYFHHPVYAPTGAHPEELEMRETIEKILMAAGVQVVFSGHDHFYARMRPQNGITYIISGGGGKELKNPRKTPETASMARAYHFIYAKVDRDKMELTVIPDIGPSIDSVKIPQATIPVAKQ